jgi:hypothetical protein
VVFYVFRLRFFCVLVFWPSLREMVRARVFCTQLVSGLHPGLHNTAKSVGFRQDFLPHVQVDTKWIVSSRARPWLLLRFH